jgi:hypothetical protein
MASQEITLDKILNVNARDYVESRGRTLDQYEMIGIHTSEPEVEDFIKLVPHGAEVVTNYRHVIAGVGPASMYGSKTFVHHQYGIALIPRPNHNNRLEPPNSNH